MLVQITNDKFTLKQNACDILSGVSLKINTTESNEILKIADQSCADDVTTITYKAESDQFFKLTLTIKSGENNALFYVDGGTEQKFLIDANCFDKQKGIEFIFDEFANQDGMMSLYLHKTWWTRPDFTKDINEIPAKTQAVAMTDGENHTFLLPVCTEEFKSEFNKNTLRLFTGCDGYCKISGLVLSVGCADSPFKANKIAFDAPIKSGDLKIKKRCEKTFPEHFKYLGWCTWDAFYHSVSDEKMTALKEALAGISAQEWN